MTWQDYRLGDVVESVQSGFACGEKSVVGGFKHLRMNNIHSDGRLDLSLVRTVPHDLATPKYRLQPDDVLVCTTNSGKLVGKSAMFRAEGDFAFSNHLTRLRLRHDVADPAFVQKQLWFKWLHGEIEPLCKHWVNQSTLPKEELLDLEVSLPELDEQQRIATKLDQIAARLDDTRARLESVPAILKRFRMSVLAAACSGRLTEDWRKDRKLDGAEPVTADSEIDLLELPGNWRYARLGAVITGQKYGTSKRCTYDRIGRPVLRIPNIGEGGRIDGCDLKYGELPDSEYEQLALREGDLLLIRSNGSVSLVGRCSRVTPEFRGYAYAGYLIRLRPDDNMVLPEYLVRAMASQTLRVQIELPARSTSGVNNINSSEVGNLLVPLPPLEEQAEIVRRIDAMFKQADVIEANYSKAKTFTDKLMPSILSKAFRGELA